MPVDAWLGIHVTVDLAGQVRFGPDIQWVDNLVYDVDPERAAPFYQAVRSYWPALPDGALQPGYAGIRPKLVPEGVAAPEAANNAACTGSFVPLLTLGVPGSGTTAVLLGALLVMGVGQGWEAKLISLVAIFLACLIGNPRIFWWVEIGPLSLICLIGLLRHRRVERRFVHGQAPHSIYLSSEQGHS